MESHAQVREQVPGEILAELEKSGDSVEIEDGVHKFVEWIRSGKLEISAYPSEHLHAKLYIMTFAEGDRDKGPRHHRFEQPHRGRACRTIWSSTSS